MLKILVRETNNLSEMARTLNNEGFTTSRGGKFTAKQVSILINRYQLKWSRRLENYWLNGGLETLPPKCLSRLSTLMKSTWMARSFTSRVWAEAECTYITRQGRNIPTPSTSGLQNRSKHIDHWYRTEISNRIFKQSLRPNNEVVRSVIRKEMIWTQKVFCLTFGVHITLAVSFFCFA